MSLKKPTPRRILMDRKTATNRPIPVNKETRKTVLTKKPIKRALDQKTVREMKWKKQLEDRKKVGDATFEITEENFKQLIKETIIGVFKEYGIIQTETSEDTPIDEEITEKVELESVEPTEPEDEEHGDEPEPELEGDEPEENEEKIEDDDVLAGLLNDPAKKKALLEVLKDGKAPKKKGEDAASVFVNDFNRYNETPKQTRIETEAPTSGYNRYAIK